MNAESPSAPHNRARQRKNRWRKLKFDLLRGTLFSILVPILKLWMKTWRFSISDMAVYAEVAHPPCPIVLAILHGNAICCVGGIYQKLGGHSIVSSSLVSPSRDGLLMSDVLVRFGQTTVMGSSKKRGVAGFLELKNAVKDNGLAVVACDGPRGPRAIPQGGVLTLARATNARMYVMVCGARPAIRFKSWDRQLLPLPFARVRVAIVHYRDFFQGNDAFDLQSERARVHQIMMDKLRELGEPVDDIKPLSEA